MRDGTPPCQPCKDARARQTYAWRNKVYLLGGPVMIDATGTRRRLQALSRLGWATRILAERIGRNHVNVLEIMKDQDRVYVETAEIIKRLYDDLSMVPPEETPGSKRVRTFAAKKHYAPPLAWDDETMDDPEVIPAGLNVTNTRNWLRRWGTREQLDRWEAERSIRAA